ncbi:MAG: glycosyltransferase family 9 protein [Cystobacterineae bacterium]|nr:glycosyltransferase family 9 protein [Cystobacterineae bacterium]
MANHVLIIRFSAMGDVAMSVPVVDALARQYPETVYTVLSQEFFRPLFAYCPPNVRFWGTKKHMSLVEIYRLYRELSKQSFNAIADLHNVLRSQFLRMLFCCRGIKTQQLDKGRKEKRRLTRKRNKIYRPLKPITERYADVFHALGQGPERVGFQSIFGLTRGNFRKIEALTGKKSGAWIGIAPFAKHPTKTFPPERMEQVVAHFSRRANTTLFLFGGGATEKKMLEEWSQKYPQAISVPQKLELSAELILIGHLDLMLSMDSANMHLASLTATPVISIWGATHPYAGFYGYGQLPAHAMQAKLSCRPCSVYGNKACHRKNMECLSLISPQMLIEKIENTLSLANNPTERRE